MAVFSVLLLTAAPPSQEAGGAFVKIDGRESLLRAVELFLNRENIKQMAGYDDRFCRMWDFYLAGCEVAFRYMNQMVFQIQIARRQDAVPLTRDYMIEAENAVSAPSSMAAE